ncbi:hypothetical protein Goarm_010131, partial [Gossypium armourianum]|nr:hypothetical protein [Gossypium armourianum]
MSQLMSIMGDIKRKIGIGVLSNTKNNPWRERKEHEKAITLRSGKVLSSLEKLAYEENKEDSEDLQGNSQETKNEPEPEEEAEPVVESEGKPINDPTLKRYHRWEHFRTVPKENIVIPLVQEFYAALRDEETRRPFGVMWKMVTVQDMHRAMDPSKYKALRLCLEVRDFLSPSCDDTLKECR